MPLCLAIRSFKRDSFLFRRLIARASSLGICSVYPAISVNIIAASFLSISAEENPQFDIVTDLLRNALTIDFGTPYDSLVSNVIAGDSLIIPVTVTSLTAHSIPSGVPFAREAWLEVLVIDNENDTLYQSGVV